MKKILKNLQHQIKILNSLYYLVFFAFLIDLSIIAIINLNFSNAIFLKGIFLSILAVVKISFYGGFYGILVEIASEQEIFLTFRRFKQNVKDGWLFYIILSAFICILYLILITNIPNSNITLLLFFSYFDIVFCLGLAYLIISKKYSFSRGDRMSFDPKFFFSTIFIYVVKIVLVHMLESSNDGSVIIDKLIALMAQYFHFLLFVNISMQFIKHCSSDIEERQRPEIYLITPVVSGVLEPIINLILGNLLNFFYPPVFLILRGLTPKKYIIREFYNRFWNDRYYKSNKLVVITCYTFNSYEAYSIAKGFKEKGSTVVIGGFHVSFLPDEALEYCDSVVIGEAVGAWEEVINDYEKGTMKKKYYSLGPLDDPESVQKELMSASPEIASKLIETTRGCKFDCEFCAGPMMCGRQIRKKPVKDILAIIKKVRHQCKHFCFLDANIYADPKYFIELFEEIKKLKIKWIASCSIDIATNVKALTLAKESGCKILRFGYEITDQSVEIKQGGKFSLANKYSVLTKKVRDKGIHVTAFLIFGHDSDNFKSFLDLIRFSLVNPFFTRSVCILTPYPGTRLYYRKLAEDKIRNLNWMDYNASKFVLKHDKLNEPLYEVIIPIIFNLIFFRPLTYAFLFALFYALGVGIFSMLK
ncbi:MAG: radical SAM protein [Candidatus Omnitrophica bacterium]|nr:radical SAM protein [Candidatus Omnitrophota bacterium]